MKNGRFTKEDLKNLHAGYYVLNRDGSPCPIESVDDTGVVVEGNHYSVSEIVGVPITREVIEKIGFKLYGSTFMYIFLIEKYDRVVYNLDSKMLYVQRLFNGNKHTAVKAEYVHELQWAFDEYEVDRSFKL